MFFSFVFLSVVSLFFMFHPCVVPVLFSPFCSHRFSFFFLVPLRAKSMKIQTNTKTNTHLNMKLNINTKTQINKINM